MTAGKIVWKVDKRDRANQLVRDAAGDALADAAEFLLEESNRTVPLEEATLERSGQASVDRPNLRAAVSYDTPYARRQHEDTRLRHGGGRRAKWLERTFTEQRTRIGEFIAGRIRRATGR